MKTILGIFAIPALFWITCFIYDSINDRPMDWLLPLVASAIIVALEVLVIGLMHHDKYK